VKIKEIEHLLFEDPKHIINCVFPNIYKITESRLKGSAYRIAAELHALPIREHCPVCDLPTRNKNHIFLECPMLKNIRTRTARWIELLADNEENQKFVYKDVQAIWHNNLNSKQSQVLAIQNLEIWKGYCKWWFEKKFDKEEVEKRVEQKVRFRLLHGKL
jgi:hypothetical protein